MSKWRMFGLAVACMIIAVGAVCSRAAEPDNWAEQFRAYEARKAKTRVLAKLFPEAAEVRLFAWRDVEKNGHFVRQQLVPKGITISRAEEGKLRHSVFFAEPPPAIAACCIPHHMFKFYDRRGTVIGTLEVCFLCACAHLNGENSPKHGLDWIDWNIEAVGEIIKAHRLPLLLEDR